MSSTSKYTDEERAHAVSILKAEGYPDKRGALMEASRKTGYSKSMLKRWFWGSQAAVPPEIQQMSDTTLKQMFENYIRKAMPRIMAVLDDEILMKRVNIRDFMTTIAIAVDKLQLLQGQPTEIVETTWKQKARELGLSEDVIREAALAKLRKQIGDGSATDQFTH